MSNSLLDDLLEEDHAWALSGTKKIPKKEQIRNTPNNWSDDKSWVSEGYVAHVFQSKCQCGVTSRHCWGIFHRERNPAGAVKELKLQGKIQIPLDQKYPIRIIQSPDTNVCLSCLPAQGFSEESVYDESTHAEVYTHGRS